MENHANYGWTKFGSSEPGQVTHCLFMAAAYPKVMKEADLLGLQSSASLPDKGGRNSISCLFSRILREDVKMSRFKTVIYDLSNESWYCNETSFTHMQIPSCQWVCAGALVSPCRDFIASCVLNVLICFSR